MRTYTVERVEGGLLCVVDNASTTARGVLPACTTIEQVAREILRDHARYAQDGARIEQCLEQLAPRLVGHALGAIEDVSKITITATRIDEWLLQGAQPPPAETARQFNRMPWKGVPR